MVFRFGALKESGRGRPQSKNWRRFGRPALLPDHFVPEGFVLGADFERVAFHWNFDAALAAFVQGPGFQFSFSGDLDFRGWSFDQYGGFAPVAADGGLLGIFPAHIGVLHVSRRREQKALRLLKPHSLIWLQNRELKTCPILP